MVLPLLHWLSMCRNDCGVMLAIRLVPCWHADTPCKFVVSIRLQLQWITMRQKLMQNCSKVDAQNPKNTRRHCMTLVLRTKMAE
jgi:hypothetical protein